MRRPRARRLWVLVFISFCIAILLLALHNWDRGISPGGDAQASLYGQAIPRVDFTPDQTTMIEIVCSSPMIRSEVPTEVRTAWEGVVLKARPITNTTGTGVISHKSVSVTVGYAVPWKDAMAALAKYGKHGAIRWWNAAVPQPPLDLLFDANACREATLKSGLFFWWLI